MNFDEWFYTFLEEKVLINLVIKFENDLRWNYMPIKAMETLLNELQ